MSIALAIRLSWHERLRALGGRLGLLGRSTRDAIKSFATSVIVHAVAIVLLGVVAIHSPPVEHRIELISSSFSAAQLEPGNLARLVRDEQPSGEPPATRLADRSIQRTKLPVSLEQDQALDQRGPRWAPPLNVGPGSGLLASTGGVDGATSLAGRRGTVREHLLETGGGNKFSEAAVVKGLNWLTAHQRSDGAWHFDHTDGPCAGACTNPGKHRSTTAATSLALLAYLGAGHTQREGDYQEVVRKGLYYLRGQMKPDEHGGDFRQGTMYGQGLSAIALCEAFAMTQDPALADASQAAIDFILWAQDTKGGGWRYAPGEPGDATVSGWMFMALRAGQMSYLKIPAEPIHKATRFLDSLGAEQGAFYGYRGPDKDPTCTSIGLLCRMYTGWRREHPPLARGVKFLARRGPSPTDMYYNYYATQVMHHWGGSEWVYWNKQLRDFLVRTQAAEGHASGSWYFDDEHQSSVQGGRLFNTALAIMTLEVYYRYLPLYDKRSVNDSF